MKILIPMDGSAHANAALDFVASRTTLLGLDPEVQLLNVQASVAARVVRAIGGSETRAYQHAQADEVLRPALDRLQRAGIVAKASYSLGQGADAIGAIAVRSRCDLIEMGSRGHSALKGLIFGSMTSAVLASCTKPLLVLRSGTPPRRDTLLVGIAVDGSPFGLAAARLVLKHRELFGAAPRLQLIHVLGTSARKAARDDSVAPLPRNAHRQIPIAESVGNGAADAAAIDKIVAPVRKLFTQAVSQTRGASWVLEDRNRTRCTPPAACCQPPGLTTATRCHSHHAARVARLRGRGAWWVDHARGHQTSARAAGRVVRL